MYLTYVSRLRPLPPPTPRGPPPPEVRHPERVLTILRKAVGYFARGLRLRTPASHVRRRTCALPAHECSSMTFLSWRMLPRPLPPPPPKEDQKSLQEDVLHPLAPRSPAVHSRVRRADLPRSLRLSGTGPDRVVVPASSMFSPPAGDLRLVTQGHRGHRHT